ncbi:hypothetical protein PPL_03999 [Heterostelium album PN500]|uniref:DUF5009 domain-containing protein n=1 Tax=Heterostelium pallidum (strain ATCC 26659 / Pp 5 / PN500) TaxID=670386 RepID=D3B5R1_HETP5|nr:hypothetical protein PPL_03999 [Heterostelium album PN500]EFA83209.1 hypothetical protein PPL_03999 [Heterostelium album PN500]|eukprot:XP_020435326.1 hypothetical protein PPL_03999 [Heterostelium album PN500]
MTNTYNSIVFTITKLLLIVLLVSLSMFTSGIDGRRVVSNTQKIASVPYVVKDNITIPSTSKLDYDLCLLRVTTNFTVSEQSPLVIMYQFDACYDCAYQELVSLTNQSTEFFTLSTEFGYKFNFTVYDDNGKILQTDSMVYQFGENGVYEIRITAILDHNAKAMIHEVAKLKDPINPFIPIAVAFGIAAGIAILWPIAVHYYKKSKSESLEYQLHHLESNDPKKDRMKSLDVFRGLSITIMIFVNYGGGGYWFFNHSYWNGLTVADLVFPWFVFIMGCAMPMSFNALESRGVPKKTIVIKLVRRSITLFALGMFLNNGNDLQHWRILGVLQRFGISYLVTGLIMMFVPVWRYRQLDDLSEEQQPLYGGGSIQDRIRSRYPRMFADILPYWIQWVVALMLLSVWFLVTFLLPVPGCPTGYIGPGGIGSQGQYANCTGGAARYVDLKIFGENHIYQTPTCQTIYNTGSYDPEGTLGYITSIFMCFLGVQCGRTILAFKKASCRLIRWSIWGVVLCGIAAGLCGMSQNNGWLPINKNLWTPSFVLLLSGFGFFVLSFMYIFIDLKKLWNGAPFIYVGMNPITIYMGHEILGGYFPFSFYMRIGYSKSQANYTNIAENTITFFYVLESIALTSTLKYFIVILILCNEAAAVMSNNNNNRTTTKRKSEKACFMCQLDNGLCDENHPCSRCVQKGQPQMCYFPSHTTSDRPSQKISTEQNNINNPFNTNTSLLQNSNSNNNNNNLFNNNAYQHQQQLQYQNPTSSTSTTTATAMPTSTTSTTSSSTSYSSPSQQPYTFTGDIIKHPTANHLYSNINNNNNNNNSDININQYMLNELREIKEGQKKLYDEILYLREKSEKLEMVNENLVSKLSMMNLNLNSSPTSPQATPTTDNAITYPRNIKEVCDYYPHANLFIVFDISKNPPTVVDASPAFFKLLGYSKHGTVYHSLDNHTFIFDHDGRPICDVVHCRLLSPDIVPKEFYLNFNNNQRFRQLTNSSTGSCLTSKGSISTMDDGTPPGTPLSSIINSNRIHESPATPMSTDPIISPNIKSPSTTSTTTTTTNTPLNSNNNNHFNHNNNNNVIIQPQPQPPPPIISTSNLNNSNDISSSNSNSISDLNTSFSSILTDSFPQFNQHQQQYNSGLTDNSFYPDINLDIDPTHS